VPEDEGFILVISGIKEARIGAFHAGDPTREIAIFLSFEDIVCIIPFPTGRQETFS
jgi:hypothetical protein